LATIWQQDWQYQPNAAVMYVGKGGIVTALKRLALSVAPTCFQYHEYGRRTGLKIRFVCQPLDRAPGPVLRQFTSRPERHKGGLASEIVVSCPTKDEAETGILQPFLEARDHAMKETPNRSRPAPEGWHTVTPRIVAHDAKQLVEFLKNVFGGTGEYRQGLPSEVRIGDSLVMISDAGIRSPISAFLYVYVGDTDATYRRALDAGAHALEAPSDMAYGDRRCMVEDKWGNTWQIATQMGVRDDV
jgi:PhnB protein